MSKVRVRPETGQLYLDFSYRGQRCREQTGMPDTPDNRLAAHQLLRQIDAEIRAGSFDYTTHFPGSPRARMSLPVPAAAPSTSVKPATPLLREFADTWFNESKPRWRRSYAATVRNTLDKHVIAHFGDRLVGEISRAELLAFRATVVTRPDGAPPRSASHVNRIMTITRMILAEAAERYEFSSPYRAIKPLRVPRTDVQPFTIEEVHRILGAVRPDYRAYLTVRFFTGLRTAEINGLKWKYVDFEREQILVRETWDGERCEYTKTDGSQREIPMLPIVRAALRERRERCTTGSEFVFATRHGIPLDTHNFTQRVWYPLLRHLGLEKRRPYQTRHTAATLMLASGEAPEWIARILGHSTTEMLFTVYSRFVPNLTRHDGRAFAGLVESRLASAPQQNA